VVALCHQTNCANAQERGEHGLAIWKLWSLRNVAKNAKRIDDLIGYLLRKKYQLANYEERHACGEWIASTRVEMLFGRVPAVEWHRRFAVLQTSRHELDRIRRTRRRNLRRKYQTNSYDAQIIHTSS